LLRGERLFAPVLLGFDFLFQTGGICCGIEAKFLLVRLREVFEIDKNHAVVVGDLQAGRFLLRDRDVFENVAAQRFQIPRETVRVKQRGSGDEQGEARQLHGQTYDEYGVLAISKTSPACHPEPEFRSGFSSVVRHGVEEPRRFQGRVVAADCAGSFDSAPPAFARGAPLRMTTLFEISQTPQSNHSSAGSKTGRTMLSTFNLPHGAMAAAGVDLHRGQRLERDALAVELQPAFALEHDVSLGERLVVVRAGVFEDFDEMYAGLGFRRIGEGAAAPAAWTAGRVERVQLATS
jgi:hypothetical protein